MIDFLKMLPFAPVIVGLTWLYMSPLRRLDGNTLAKVIIRIALSTAILGGFFAQLNFLAHREPANLRRPYLMALLIIEAIPMLTIMFYRTNKDPASYGLKPTNRTDQEKSNR
jgi:hypothetical protein